MLQKSGLEDIRSDNKQTKKQERKNICNRYPT